MAKTAPKKKANSAHRKVQASTVHHRKTVQRQDSASRAAETKTKIILRNDKRAENPIKQPERAAEAKILKKSEIKLNVVSLDKEPEKKAEKKTEANVVKVEEAKAKVPVPQPKPTAKAQKEISQPKPTAKEQKEAAIAKAIVETKSLPETRRRRSSERVHFGFRRVVLAMACAAAAVFAIVYFVNQSTPNISLKVAAMQSGIDAKYPAYVPRDFSLSDITSENGRITLNFHNASTSESFTIVEEKLNWDSNALLANYVRDTYRDDYTQVEEQGLTIYISGSDACWANGGVVYKLKTTSGSLTKKQIKAIAVSL